MKNKLRQWRKRLSEKPMAQNVAGFFKWLWRTLSHNLWLKLVSLVLAVLLWNYVITTNTSITRPKTLYGLTGYISGQSTLTSYGLALLEDPSETLSNVSVTVQAPEAQYSRVSADNVQVMLDLSNIRVAGTREVPLRATTTYGRVEDITPSTVKLTFEELDSRSVPVNCQLVGGSEDFWYNTSRINPSLITVSGAGSVVDRIANAYVYYDVTGVESDTASAQPYVLLDAAGEEIPQRMLNRSTSSVYVSVSASPTVELPLSMDPETVLSGQPAPGYVVQSVTLQPETIVVAADRDVLSSFKELKVEPVSVEGASQSFTAVAAVSALSDFRYVSNAQVYVSVTIAEETAGGWIEDVEVAFSGLKEGLSARYEPLRVYVTGPRTQVEALAESGITLNADLSGLEAGTYQVSPTFSAQTYPDLTLQSDALTVVIEARQ